MSKRGKRRDSRTLQEGNHQYFKCCLEFRISASANKSLDVISGRKIYIEFSMKARYWRKSSARRTLSTVLHARKFNKIMALVKSSLFWNRVEKLNLHLQPLRSFLVSTSEEKYEEHSRRFSESCLIFSFFGLQVDVHTELVDLFVSQAIIPKAERIEIHGREWRGRRCADVGYSDLS
ncbi:hypothetical protein SISNIDRAFT_516297 [Sistotremastrum niveocremeum HHB9708]|uniref:Uncharacterized protein n=1 Tax=Sistotremastrum niveocremeum HHB9708 TaxID=1314777 RepID=A0A164SMI3_9AGAM|nr:hypothetical protein SISNIDRAFT_516297 [Sistotremastrum niveocremeum HHB9708]